MKITARIPLCGMDVESFVGIPLMDVERKSIVGRVVKAKPIKAKSQAVLEIKILDKGVARLFRAEFSTKP